MKYILAFITIFIQTEYILLNNNQSSFILKSTINSTIIDSGIDSSSIRICGDGNLTSLFLISNDKIVYRSINNGLFWERHIGFYIKNVSNISKIDENENDNDQTKFYKINTIAQNSIDKKMLIFIGVSKVFLSEDCGENIKEIQIINNQDETGIDDLYISQILFHPIEKNLILASSVRKCNESIQNSIVNPCINYKSYKTLYVSVDKGRTWKKMKSSIVQFSWGLTLNPSSEIPYERVIITYNPIGKERMDDDWSYKYDFVYSDDFFDSTISMIQGGNKFLLSENFLIIAHLHDEDTYELNLDISYSFISVYDFQSLTIKNKKNSYKINSFSFLDQSSEKIFIYLEEESSIYGIYGHVYSSDSTGLKYSLSLTNNIKFNSNCDFLKINGIEGVYFANILSDDYFLNLETAQNQNSNEFNDDYQLKYKKTCDSVRNYITSVISFNNGGTWERIPSPEYDFNGNEYKNICKIDCFLNLHGISYSFPMLLSIESAIGIILANGNIGKYLSYKVNDINLYLSRDSGKTWFEIKKGSYIYEIGNHGGIILIAEDGKQTKLISYSLDQGLSWVDINISDEDIIINKITSYSPTSLFFTIHGEITKASNETNLKSGIVIGLDLTHFRVFPCKGMENINANTDFIMNDISEDDTRVDYEKWQISNSDQRGCLLGKKIVYIRKKRISKCFNSNNNEEKLYIHDCDCTVDDYECDEGYYKPNFSDDCTLIDKSTVDYRGEIHKAPKNCLTTYKVSKGYRKIPGNSCVNGVKYDPIVVTCPNVFFPTMGIIFFMIILMILIGYILNYVSIIYQSTDMKDNASEYSYITKSTHTIKSDSMKTVDGGSDFTEDEDRCALNNKNYI